MFEPPIDGTYALTVYILGVANYNGPAIIKNNDNELCRTYTTGTCSVVAQLAIGDSVRVTGDSIDPTAIEATYSGFLGHIISDNLTA